jgi:uncharacterized damage-inducible protein DinB
MSGQQVVAHRFITFLVETIDAKAEQIAKETQGETAKFAAGDLRKHCKELNSAISTLLDEPEPQAPPEPQPTASRTSSRRGGANA